MLSTYAFYDARNHCITFYHHTNRQELHTLLNCVILHEFWHAYQTCLKAENHDPVTHLKNATKLED